MPVVEPVDLWVDPVAGMDDHDGRSRQTALRTIAAAWQHIPSDRPGAAHGWRIRLCAGSHIADERGVVSLAQRRGSASCPIVLRAEDSTALLPPLDVNDCSHLCVIGITIRSASNPTVPASDDNLVHFARCDHVLVRGITAIGSAGERGLPRLAFKANQCSHLYIEDCEFSGSYAYAFAYVAVQYGHILRSRFGNCGAAGICLKGGSAYHLVADNEVFRCAVMGITIGEGVGFPYMVDPWLQYEAYDITVVGNAIRESGGGLCVSGGYGIVMAHNSCYRVGASRDTIVVAMGGHVWESGSEHARVVCEQFHRAGGWCSPTADSSHHIPCRDVLIMNNLIVNPHGYESQFAHIGMSGPVSVPRDSNIPDPARMEHVRIENNLIWNGAVDKPVLDDVEDCYGLAARPTASASDLAARNIINRVQPRLTDPDRGDLRPHPACASLALPALAIPEIDAEDPHRPPVPIDPIGRAVARDRVRTHRRLGAY